MGTILSSGGTPTTSTMGVLGADVSGGNVLEPGTISKANLIAGDYNLKLYTNGDDNHGGYYHSQEPFAITTHTIGHPGLTVFTNSEKNTHRLEYGGNSPFSTFNTTDLCCNYTTSGTTDSSDCIDFKQITLNDNNCPTGTCLKSARGGKAAEVMIVRGWLGIGNGAQKFQSKSSYGTSGSMPTADRNGPTNMSFTNTHPFSDVIVKVEASVDIFSNDGAGVTLGVTSNQSGTIFNPLDHHSGYLRSTGHNTLPGVEAMWPHYFQGWLGGNVHWGSSAPHNLSSGVWNFIGARDVSAAHWIVNSNGDPNHGTTFNRVKDFGHWTVRKNETLTWDLYGALNIHGHYGYGEWEGCLVRWMKVTVVSWPNDP
tara:strand:- start:890 stop:1993 length:1104 start_codon:yes stop_codon:yes gene_type:complete